MLSLKCLFQCLILHVFKVKKKFFFKCFVFLIQRDPGISDLPITLPIPKGEKKSHFFFLTGIFSFLPTHPTSISHFLRKPFSWRHRESFPTRFPQPPQTHAHSESNLAPRTYVAVYSTLPVKISVSGALRRPYGDGHLHPSSHQSPFGDPWRCFGLSMTFLWAF